jgi:hypothetical protein
MDPCALISTGTDTVGSRVNCRFGPVVRDRQPRTFPPPAWSLSSLPHLFFFNEKKKAVRLHSRGSALVFLLPKAPMWITCARGKRNIDGIRDTNRTRSCWQPGSEFTVRLENEEPANVLQHLTTVEAVSLLLLPGTEALVLLPLSVGADAVIIVVYCGTHMPRRPGAGSVHLRAKRTGKRRRRRALAHMPRRGCPGLQDMWVARWSQPPVPRAMVGDERAARAEHVEFFFSLPPCDRRHSI